MNELVLSLFISVCLALNPPVIFAANVLVINSYHEELAWTKNGS